MPTIVFYIFLVTSFCAAQGYALYSEQNLEQVQNNEKFKKSKDDKDKYLTQTAEALTPTKTPKKTDTPGPTTPTLTPSATVTPTPTPR